MLVIIIIKLVIDGNQDEVLTQKFVLSDQDDGKFEDVKLFLQVSDSEGRNVTELEYVQIHFEGRKEKNKTEFVVCNENFLCPQNDDIF